MCVSVVCSSVYIFNGILTQIFGPFDIILLVYKGTRSVKRSTEKLGDWKFYIKNIFEQMSFKKVSFGPIGGIGWCRWNITIRDICVFGKKCSQCGKAFVCEILHDEGAGKFVVWQYFTTKLCMSDFRYLNHENCSFLKILDQVGTYKLNLTVIFTHFCRNDAIIFNKSASKMFI